MTMEKHLEWTRKVDHLEVTNEHLRLEKEHYKKDAEAAHRDKNDMQLQLSAARVQLNYHEQNNDSNNSDNNSQSKDKDESNKVSAELEAVLKEKEDLSKEAEAAKSQLQKMKVRMEEMKKQQEQMAKYAAATNENSKDKDKSDVELLKVKRVAEEARLKHEKEVKQLLDDKRKMFVEIETMKNAQEAEARKQKVLWDRQREETEKLRAQTKSLEESAEGREEEGRRAREELERRAEESQAEAERVRAESQSMLKEVCEWQRREQDVRTQMGLKNEALTRAEEARARAERERDQMKERWCDMEVKVVAAQRAERDRGQQGEDKVRELEESLKGALAERQEILEAAAKEIDHVKTIALQTEQKMMEDFEWKLREIEAEARNKQKEAGDKAATARREYEQKKDVEFTRLSISLRREMEEQMRSERTGIRQALESKALQDKETSAIKFKMERERALRQQQRAWEEEKNTVHREKRSLQRRLDEATQKVDKAVKEALEEEKGKWQQDVDKARRECDRVREEAAARVEKLREEHKKDMKALEERLESANSNRFSSMFQMKEEVEVEFSERMEALRNMYMTEMETLQRSLDEERGRNEEQERGLRETISQQRAEIDELNAYYGAGEEESRAKEFNLLSRLQEQTELAQRLQRELDEYEFYEEDDEGNIVEKDPQTKVDMERQAKELVVPAPSAAAAAASVALASAASSAVAVAAAPDSIASTPTQSGGGGAWADDPSRSNTYANPFKMLYNYRRRRK